MGRVPPFLYGVAAYAVFFVTLLYAIGFVGNLVVPKTIDTGEEASAGQAILINALLLGLFALQHSVMARSWFKERWARIVPRPIERSTYVLFTSAVLILLFWQWRPIQSTVWNAEGSVLGVVLTATFWIGWGAVLVATFLINHFDLFGLRQVWLHLRGEEYRPVRFRVPGLYKVVRHPLYLGFVLAFWSSPHMTGGHLLFAIATTGYILLAIQFEERDLVVALGDDYVQYRREVSMLLPWPRKQKATVQEESRSPAR
jgi:protein-S-isoprenylcysteine O-methyltransferase Ste14